MYAVNLKFSILFGVGNFDCKTCNIHYLLEHFENRPIELNSNVYYSFF